MRNSLILNDIEFDLLNVNNSEFMIQGVELPPPFSSVLYSQGHRKYKSLIIAGSYYGVMLKKPKSVTDTYLKQNGWNVKEICGNKTVYHKNFTGSSWWECDFEDGNVETNSYLVLKRKFVRKDVGEEISMGFYFSGYITDQNEFETICNCLNIN